MSFLDTILDNLESQPDLCALVEVHGKDPRESKGGEILDLVARARAFIGRAGVEPGDRVALLGPNSAKWVACDLAALCNGATVVPLYDRQDPNELAVMMRNSEPKLVIASEESLSESLAEAWSEHGKMALYDDVFMANPTDAKRHEFDADDTVAIIYTSGTSGEPKGVELSRANLDYMIPRTVTQLGKVVGERDGPDRIFHFLPLCFAASRIMLWTQLSRPNPVMLSTDLTNLVEEMATAKPHFFLNVPAVLERIRNGVGHKVRERGGIARALFESGWDAYQRIAAGEAGLMDRVTYSVAKSVVFNKIKHTIGPNLEFLICGSAPLSPETQSWFQMLGIGIYQAYGLTETTGIVSIDEPGKVVAGRVGYALDGIETQVSDDGELLVRGPNVFRGYWNKPDETEKALHDGWFHTGDQVDIEGGNLQIVGRIKNLIIPESGHNIAPEPLEQRFMAACPEADQCMLVGHGRPFLAIIVTGAVPEDAIGAAMDAINGQVPHYRKIRKFHVAKEPFSVENGLLTANQKLRRTVIEQHFRSAIDALYQ